MAKTRKKSQPVSNENLPESKVKIKSQKGKSKKKKQSVQLIPPNLKKKRLQKKAIVYDIVEDSILEPKTTSIIYSEEDDSFHEIAPKSDPPSDKTSTPLPSRSKTVLRSPKLLFKTESPPKSQLTTPMRDHVANVSNILTNMSNIMKQISESNCSFGISKETNINSDTIVDKSDILEAQINDSPGKKSHCTNVMQPEEAKLHTESPDSKNKTFVSQLNINLSTTDKNSPAISNINNSNYQYDSFLHEFYLKTNPHTVSVKNSKENSLSWDQNVVDYSLEFSQMLKIDPSLLDFLNAPGSIDNKMKFLITRICSLLEENECLKKHVEWLSEKYKEQNGDIYEKNDQKSELDFSLESKSAEEIKKEYLKLLNHYDTINNQLDETLRQKDNYKKSMLLHKAEKEAFEKELINLHEIEDDKIRMSELLNKQSAILSNIENIRAKNVELKQDNKILRKENSDLKQDLNNANLIISDQRDCLLDQNLDIKNLEIFCKNQQLELDKLTKSVEIESKNDVTDPNKSKSWIEQVLDEELYDTDSDNKTETDSELSFESISSNSLTENDTQIIPFLPRDNKMMENYYEEKKC